MVTKMIIGLLVLLVLSCLLFGGHVLSAVAWQISGSAWLLYCLNKFSE